MYSKIINVVKSVVSTSPGRTMTLADDVNATEACSLPIKSFKEMGRFIRDKMQVEIVVDMSVPRSVTIILIFIRLNGLMLPF